MYSRVETITPDIAKQYLKHNTTNRGISKKVISKYADDMKNGKWELNGSSISFYKNGTLANGQHRLMAVVQSGATIETLVVYDVDESVHIYDRLLVRTPAHIMQFAGYETVFANNTSVGTINYLFVAFLGKSDVSDNARMQFVDDNAKTLEKVMQICTGGISRKAPFLAAVFCALYCGIDEDGIKDFVNAVNTGFTPQGEPQTSAIVIRNYLISGYKNSNHACKKYLFNITTNAIKDFAVGKPRRCRYPDNTKPAFYEYTKKNAFRNFTNT